MYLQLNDIMVVLMLKLSATQTRPRQTSDAAGVARPSRCWWRSHAASDSRRRSQGDSGAFSLCISVMCVCVCGFSSQCRPISQMLLNNNKKEEEEKGNHIEQALLGCMLLLVFDLKHLISAFFSSSFFFFSTVIRKRSYVDMSL